ncbi:hypothetical protein [Piscinibacter sp. HJYY11]|uniref:hypothetical protein n=1 Tax=Piscinibacter sp. HJYY11 TaxID=2801333 RepID=UPI00191D4BC0|nr:hypothetical protein [Piscinibacter sp. HJYY11]MBL0729410.1 hypothetical protein [Piscinibacter sp. HJYY11]
MTGGEGVAVDLLASEQLTLEEMAAYLGVSTAEVQRREQAGELFSFFRERRGSERLYPFYQLAPEVYPSLIQRTRAAFDPDLVQVHYFFTRRDPDLGRLSVRELLAGRPHESFELDSVGEWLLSLPFARRLDAALAALERERNHCQAC